MEFHVYGVNFIRECQNKEKRGLKNVRMLINNTAVHSRPQDRAGNAGRGDV